MRDRRDLRRRAGPARDELADGLDRLTQLTLDAMWLGALLTVRLDDGALAYETQAVLGTLERLWAETIDGGDRE